MFVLSVGLYVADYFFMEQKLFNPIKGVLPQDNFANLVIAAVLTIIRTAPCRTSLELHKCSNLKAYIV